MNLEITRGQRSLSNMKRSVVFNLTVQAILTEEEQHLVTTYGLENEVLYLNQAELERKEEAVQGGFFRMIGRLIVTGVKLLLDQQPKATYLITIGSLTKGQDIECFSLAEIVETEESVRSGCENMKNYLGIAQSFSGEKEVVEI